MHRNTSIGICAGASSVSVVRMSKNHDVITIDSCVTIPHNGSPGKAVKLLLKDKPACNICTTGKSFRHSLMLTSISEAEAVEAAAEYTGLAADMIISAGGENFIVYLFGKDRKISKVFSGNKCASGTGEFFFQQINRMGLDIDEASSMAFESIPYSISGRCSVFCKSDCTHALNKGVPKGQVAAGLSRMMARKIVELTSKIKFKKAAVVGGTTQNRGMMRFLKEEIPDILVPEEATYFEALGAAVYALSHKTVVPDYDKLIRDNHSNFTFHGPLKDHLHMVSFKQLERGKACNGDECILGLDVGSTTTKAVLIKKSDNVILASEYLRTNGDPVAASIECYKGIAAQVKQEIKIKGLGVTGSGRHIAGLHALSDGVINEIIAHATATVYFDKEADTIFEIGGQDAKYTFITAGVPSDYAMNEACSAGTGSFLEEAARESLGVDYREIGDIALEAQRPPNFNDQCAAFIGSDIKNAAHEGLERSDILAGLVYSICQNYNNRVKGSRQTGKKIFMQGGVCYNKSVPAAMAALTGKEIIVPPEPGLMGAFGVALEVKNRISLKLLKEQDYDLRVLINRKIEYGKSFICAGGAEKCDRKCQIAVLSIDGDKYPFGGACNKYYSINSGKKERLAKKSNLVSLRQELVYKKYAPEAELFPDSRTVGISRSFLTNTYYPLFYNFFTQLGFRVILNDRAMPEGIDKKEAAFCYPAELAHGFFQSLLSKQPDHYFMPHITNLYNEGSGNKDKTCVLMQSEAYYLQSAFKEELKGCSILSPVLDFSRGYEKCRTEFIRMGVSLGKNRRQAGKAFDYALEMLQKMLREFRAIGESVVNELEKDENKTAIVLLGRSYNAFAKEANLEVPQKFTSRGVTIIPHDFLPVENEEDFRHMYWGTGNQILKAARYIKGHKQLFGVYITNFSCGPDSFILGYFRNIMGCKPSLTLELDSHSADAGINTRIEAVLDIISSYRELERSGKCTEPAVEFMPVKMTGETLITDSSGKQMSIKDPRVKLLIPSMGRVGSEAFSAAFRHEGIRTETLPVYTMSTLMTGRGYSTCKECLPLQLNVGSMVEYYKNRKNGEVTLFFMAKGDGPCRLGQYHVYLEELIKKLRMRNMGIFTLSDEDSYEGLGNKFVLRGWAALTISDVLKDIENAIAALAADRVEAQQIFENELAEIIKAIETSSLNSIYDQLERSAEKLNLIEKRQKLSAAKKILLTGEIFVRHDEFSRMDIIKQLADKGFVVRQSPIGEYIYYSNYLISKNRRGFKDKLKYRIRDQIQVHVENKVKCALTKSGFYEYNMTDLKETIGCGGVFINSALEGEAILTTGAALHEILENVCGVISIGPFGCMPSRVAESVLNVEMNVQGRSKARKITDIPDGIENLPYLAIETDGNLFPQLIQSKLEIFMLQAERLYNRLRENTGSKKPQAL